jgi:polyribonucleotide 5'-hydroxyl-kinase
MYKLLVSNLANIINLRFDRDPDAKASGIIVNTSGWIDGLGINVLFHIIHTLSIDIILVMNHDKLYSSLSSEIGENITIIKLPHSGGVVQRVYSTILYYTILYSFC